MFSISTLFKVHFSLCSPEDQGLTSLGLSFLICKMGTTSMVPAAWRTGFAGAIQAAALAHQRLGPWAPQARLHIRPCDQQLIILECTWLTALLPLLQINLTVSGFSRFRFHCGPRSIKMNYLIARRNKRLYVRMFCKSILLLPELPLPP